MMNKYNKYLKVVLLLLFIATGAKVKLGAQVSWDTTTANDVTVCLKPELLRIAVTVSSAGSGSYFDVGMPNGFAYNYIAYQNVPSGNTITYAGKFGNRHRFNIAGAPATGSVLRLWIMQTAQCGTVGTTTFKDTIYFYNGASTINQLSNAFNSTAASISITGTTNTPGSVSVGTTVTRSMSITNGGTGKTQRFRYADKFTAGALSYIAGSAKINPSGSNFTIPTSKITIKTDSIIIDFDSVVFVNMTGGADKYFDPSESFVLQYQVQPNNCGVGFSVTSSLYAWWGCPGLKNSCQAGSSSTGIGILTAGNPSISRILTKNQAFKCFGNLQVDTVFLKNSGAGAATNISITTYQGYPGTGYFPTWYRNIDTGAIRYKIGKNGTWVDPVSFTSITSGNRGGGAPTCTGIGRAAFTVPTLAAGDTIIVLVPFKVCNLDMISEYGCVSAGTYITPRIAVISQEYNYFDACGSIPFSVGQQHITSYDGWDNQFSIASVPSSVIGGGTATAKWQINQSNHTPFNTTKSKMRIVVTRPGSGWGYDFSSSFPIQVQIGATLYNPNKWDTATGVFEFQGPAANSTSGSYLILKIKAPACSGFVGGDVNYQISKYYSADTSLGCAFISHSCLNWKLFYDCPVICPQGVIVLDSFTTRRHNLGLPDNNNDGTPDVAGVVDLTKIALKRLENGDTMRITWAGHLQLPASGTHSKMQYLYAGIYGSNATFKTNFTPLAATVNLKRNPLPDTSWTVTGSWSVDTFRYNLSYSRNYINGDSIEVIAKWRNATGYTTGYSGYTWDTRPLLYASHVANPVSADTSVRRSCGRKVDNISITNWGESVSGSTPIVDFTGCGQQVYPFYMGNIFENSTASTQNYFEYEYRPTTLPEYLRFLLPTGYTMDSARYIYSRHTTTSSDISVSGTLPYTMSGDTISFTIASLFKSQGGTLLEGDDAYRFQINTYIKSSCKALEGVSQTNPWHRWSFLPVPIATQLANISPNDRSGGTALGSGYRSFKPAITINSSNPSQDVYSSTVQWPLTVRENVSRSAPFTWLSFVSPSGKVVVDSIKTGSTVITKDANGFFQLGAFNGNLKNYTVYAKNTACNNDSIMVYYGYGCSAYPTVPFNTSICSYTPGKLYLSPKPAEIQTTVTALASTPSVPSNASSAAYGSSTIPDICAEMPVEILINSAQPGTLYNVHELLNIPVNGGLPGLSFKSGSGYIEWPLGTAPRAFSSAANTALSASGLTQLDLSLTQIDPSNFSATSGLPGTGTAPTSNHRQAKLRFILKSNCSMLNGDQWTTTQKADAPCGGTATGNNQTTSGYIVAVNGVSNPYTMNTLLTLSKDSIAGYNDSLKATATLQKIGSASVSATDTIRIIFPSNSQIGVIKCFGTRCPSATPTFRISTNGSNKEYKLIVPGTLGNADTLRFETWLKSSPTGSGCSNSNSILFRTTEEATLYCSTTGANCPGAQIILGQQSKTYDIDKPELAITAVNAELSNSGSWYTYNYNVFFTNSGKSSVPVNSGQVLQIYFDADNDGILNTSVDRLVNSKTYNTALAVNSSDNITGTFTDPFLPSPTRKMWAVWNSAVQPNCNCTPLIASAPVIGLPINVINYRIKTNGCRNTLSWTVTGGQEISSYQVQWSKEANLWNTLGSVNALNHLSGGSESYLYTHTASEGKNFYRVIAQDKLGKQTPYNVLYTYNNCNLGYSNVVLLPNPASREVEFNVTDNIRCSEYKVSISSANGSLVYNDVFVKNNGLISLKDIAPGIYIVKVSCEAFSETIKLVVQ